MGGLQKGIQRRWPSVPFVVVFLQNQPVLVNCFPRGHEHASLRDQSSPDEAVPRYCSEDVSWHRVERQIQKIGSHATACMSKSIFHGQSPCSSGVVVGREESQCLPRVATGESSDGWQHVPPPRLVSTKSPPKKLDNLGRLKGGDKE